MYDVILVPLDGSKRAEAIIPHVKALVNAIKSRVVFVTAMEHKVLVNAEGIPSELDTEELEQRTKDAESYLSRLTDEFRKMDIQTEFKVLFGPAIDVIGQVAEQERAGLIALASHGRTGLGRVFYGSIAAGLLNSIDRPMLIVRSRDFKSDATLQWGKDVL